MHDRQKTGNVEAGGRGQLDDHEGSRAPAKCRLEYERSRLFVLAISSPIFDT